MEPERPIHEVTRILSAIQGDDLKAADGLLPLVYDELRRLAGQKLSREKCWQMLQATALVHEAYIRPLGAEDAGWKRRGHSFTAAAEAVRRILVDDVARLQLWVPSNVAGGATKGAVVPAAPGTSRDVRYQGIFRLCGLSLRRVRRWTAMLRKCGCAR